MIDGQIIELLLYCTVQIVCRHLSKKNTRLVYHLTLSQLAGEKRKYFPNFKNNECLVDCNAHSHSVDVNTYP